MLSTITSFSHLPGLVTGTALTARPSKIIAGQEPDKTNEFLQLLGRCAAKGVSYTHNADIVALTCYTFQLIWLHSFEYDIFSYYMGFDNIPMNITNCVAI